MGDAIGQILAPAVGVALSPLSIVVVLLTLATQRARVNGPAFVLGWLIGLGIVGAVVLLISSGAGASHEGEPATWVSILKVVPGALLLVYAWKQWRSRPEEGDAVAAPKWIGALSAMGSAKALLAGALLAGANPKNFQLAIGASTIIAEAGLAAWEQAVSYLVFALVGAIGVGLPVVLFFTLGDRWREPLESLRDWMSLHNAAITAALCLVLGVKLIGDALAGLT